VVSSDAQEEFDRLFESSKRPLVGQAYLLTGDLQDAQDLAQEAFLRG
jgi:RNA polymerase sigma-70 factor (ECF subfamily)